MFSSISMIDLKSLIGRVNIIDIRDNYLYNLGHIPNSKNIPINFLLVNPSNYLDKDKKYYIYCQKGFNSIKACSKLYSDGYDVINIDGGYNSYINN